MTIQNQKKVIDEFTFELTQLPAFTALTAFQRFLAIVGPIIPALSAAVKLKGRGQDGELPPETSAQLLDVLGNALPAALAKASPDEVLELTKVLLGPCLVQPKGGKFIPFLEVGDELLRGRLKVLIRLIAWAVGVHFGSFFADLGALAPAAPAAASGSTSPQS